MSRPCALPPSFSVEERIHRSVRKLAALSAFLRSANENTEKLSPEERTGLSEVLDDMREELRPILNAPLEVLGWQPK